MEHPDILVIGAGIFGCAAAYYLKRDHPRLRVTVVDRQDWCNAATSRAAALMTIVRAKTAFIPLSLETYAVIPELEHILGETLPLHQVGIIHVAQSAKTKQDLHDLLKIAEEYHQPYQRLTPGEARDKAPWLSLAPDDTAVFMPREAFVDPYLLGTFFARAARQLGAKFILGEDIKSLKLHQGQITSAEGERHRYTAHHFILAAGVWSPLLARLAGIHPPMAPVRSQYWITSRVERLFPATSPMVILPDQQAYARPENGGLLFGLREKKGFYRSPADLPSRLEEVVFSPDRGFGDLEENMNRLVTVFPDILDVCIAHYVAGFSGYTPDNYLTLGQSPTCKNLSLAAGCVGAGISVSGGVGRILAALAVQQPSPFEISAFALDRFGEVDVFSDDWLKACSAARALKESG